MAEEIKDMSDKPKIEKQLELIKYLHTPHTLKECSEFLSECSDRTIRNLLKKEEISFLDTKLPMCNRTVKGTGKHISDAKMPDGTSVIEGTDYEYRSTVHPVFLALNMTEVYMLTYHLLDLVETSSWEELNIYKHLVEKIYSQLSDPARRRIDQFAERKYFLEKHDLVEYESEEEMFHRYNKTVLEYAYKAGEKVRIVLKDDTSLEGRIIFEKGGLYLKTNQDKKMKVSDFYNQISIIEKIPKIGK